MGTLRINGRIRISQFWPQGTSDADTTQLEIEVQSNSFAYARDGKNFKITRVFEETYVLGRGGRMEVIKFSKRDTISKVNIRLQGIDAPELHYRAPALKASKKISASKRKKYNEHNEEFCQAFAGNAAYALGVYLQRKAGKGASYIEAEFYSHNIEEPADVLDTNGRFVGNIVVAGQDINLWLARSGWVVPTFYSSMSEEEMTILTKACRTGRAKKRVWGKNLVYRCSFFEKKRIYKRPPVNYDPGSDKGKVLIPKLFRRVVNYRVEKAANTFTGTFLKYATDRGKSDTFYDLDEFLEQGVYSATVHRISDFLIKNSFNRKIDQVVFTEGPSTLKRKENNTKVGGF